MARECEISSPVSVPYLAVSGLQMHATISGLSCTIWDPIQVVRLMCLLHSVIPLLRLLGVCCLEHSFDYQQVNDKVKGRKRGPKKMSPEAIVPPSTAL